MYKNDHVYKCAVPGTDIFIHMKGVSPKDYDKHVCESWNLNPEARAEMTVSLVVDHIVEIEGYEGIDNGRQLYEEGDLDVWQFAQGAVLSTKVLRQHEVKNS